MTRYLVLGTLALIMAGMIGVGTAGELRQATTTDEMLPDCLSERRGGGELAWIDLSRDGVEVRGAWRCR